MGNQNQPFLNQNPGPFVQQGTYPRQRWGTGSDVTDQGSDRGVSTAPQAPPPENHFGQVDVNDLLSKLLSTGIIKPPSQAEAEATPTGESANHRPALWGGA